jgi:transcriptional regulator with XRE-family HTH domain
MSQTFGQRLQELRQKAGVSQSQLARAAGIPMGTLKNLEQDRRVPRLDTADALARALGITLDTLTAETMQNSGVTTAEEQPAPPRGRPKKAPPVAEPAGEDKPKKTTRKRKEK